MSAPPASHESKGMPVLVQEDKVTEAFGALKAPKLVSQIKQEENQVRAGQARNLKSNTQHF